jgi:hypothetical protein
MLSGGERDRTANLVVTNQSVSQSRDTRVFFCRTVSPAVAVGPPRSGLVDERAPGNDLIPIRAASTQAIELALVTVGGAPRHSSQQQPI